MEVGARHQCRGWAMAAARDQVFPPLRDHWWRRSPTRNRPGHPDAGRLAAIGAASISPSRPSSSSRREVITRASAYTAPPAGAASTAARAASNMPAPTPSRSDARTSPRSRAQVAHGALTKPLIDHVEGHGGWGASRPVSPPGARRGRVCLDPPPRRYQAGPGWAPIG
jgi:hypothetical protein